MRYLDLAMAALIGISAVTGVIAWDPRGGDATSRQARTQILLRDGLLDLLRQRGVLWLTRAPPGVVCAFLIGESNSSYGLYASWGSTSCGILPPPESVVASVEVDVGPSEVTLSGWSLG